jgi:hypothetical protein
LIYIEERQIPILLIYWDYFKIKINIWIDNGSGTVLHYYKNYENIFPIVKVPTNNGTPAPSGITGSKTLKKNQDL